MQMRAAQLEFEIVRPNGINIVRHMKKAPLLLAILTAMFLTICLFQLRGRGMGLAPPAGDWELHPAWWQFNFLADCADYLVAAPALFIIIAPVREKSGRQLWVHWRWNAPKFLRQTFVEWAGSTVVHSAWARAYYQQQRRAGKRRQAALRALAFKWIRIVWRCWQTRTPYDEARYINALSRRQSPLAIELAPS
jgi:hypothetical protein